MAVEKGRKWKGKHTLSILCLMELDDFNHDPPGCDFGKLHKKEMCSDNNWISMWTQQTPVNTRSTRAW